MGKIISTNTFLSQTHNICKSKWYHDRHYRENVQEDLSIQEYIDRVLTHETCPANKIVIQRTSQNIQIILNIPTHTITKLTPVKESVLKKIVYNLSNLLNKRTILCVQKTASMDAKSIAEYITIQLRRGKTLQYCFNKVSQAIKSNSFIKGLKIQCAGRPKKMDMARTEWLKLGQIPLHSYQTKVDFAATTVVLRYGKCGIKVWLNTQ